MKDKPDKCENCHEKPAIVGFGGFWLCKDCFNQNMEQAGRLIQKLKRELVNEVPKVQE
jgi:hypothetical protein